MLAVRGVFARWFCTSPVDSHSKPLPFAVYLLISIVCSCIEAKDLLPSLNRFTDDEVLVRDCSYCPVCVAMHAL
jgi:hypothetical protein